MVTQTSAQAGSSLLEVLLAASVVAAVAASAAAFSQAVASARLQHTAAVVTHPQQNQNLLREVPGAVPLSVSHSAATLWVPGPDGSGGAIVTYRFGHDGLRRATGGRAQVSDPLRPGDGRFETYTLEGTPAHPHVPPRRLLARTADGHALVSLVHPGLTHVATASVQRIIPAR